MNSINEALCEKIKQALEDIKKDKQFRSNAQIARYLDIDTAQLCRWSNGTTIPSAPSILKMINHCPRVAPIFLNKQVLQEILA